MWYGGNTDVSTVTHQVKLGKICHHLYRQTFLHNCHKYLGYSNTQHNITTANSLAPATTGMLTISIKKICTNNGKKAWQQIITGPRTSNIFSINDLASSLVVSKLSLHWKQNDTH